MSDRESSSARLCILYKYAYENDKEMLHELERVKGRIIDITDIKMLQKITEIIDKQTNTLGSNMAFKKIRSPRASLFDI